MLLQVLANEVEQRCDICGAQRRVAMEALSAGIEFGEPPEPMDPNVIALPLCSECGAREFVRRVGSAEPGAAPGGVDDVADHRRGLNALHAALVAAGRMGSSFGEWFATESLATECAKIPWTFAGEPVPIVGVRAASEVAFEDFVANRRGGG